MARQKPEYTKESKRGRVELDLSNFLGGGNYDDDLDAMDEISAGFDSGDVVGNMIRNYGKALMGRGDLVRELQEITTDEELLDYVDQYFHVRIPEVAVTEGHRSPADAFCDAFFERSPVALWWASRASSKSFLTGLLTVLDTLRFARCETTILAGSEQQGHQVYDAASTHIYKGKIDKFIDLKKTFAVSQGNGSSFRVLTASPKSARGPHPQRLKLDEVDEIPEDVFNAAINQPMSKHGVRKHTLMTSTMHRVGGLMTELIENAQTNGIEVYKWNYKEVTERCYEPDCRSLVLSERFRGEQCPLLGKHHQSLTDLNEEDRAYIAPAQEYVLYDDGKLADEDLLSITGYYDGSCQGGLRRSDGFVSIDDQRGAYLQVPRRVWAVENECRRPSQEDMVYDPILLERGSIDTLYWDFDLDLSRNWAMVDWGFNNPTALLIAQERILPGRKLTTHPYHRCIIKEWYWEQRGLNWRIEQIVEVVQQYGIQQIYADGENIDALHALREALQLADWPCLVRGVPFNRFKDKLIDDVRNDMEQGHWFVAEQGCPNLIKDLYRLHYRPNTENVAKENDHGPDAMIAGWRRFLDLGEFMATGQSVGVLRRTNNPHWQPNQDGNFSGPGRSQGMLRPVSTQQFRRSSPVGASGSRGTPATRRLRRHG